MRSTPTSVSPEHPARYLSVELAKHRDDSRQHHMHTQVEKGAHAHAIKFKVRTTCREKWCFMRRPAPKACHAVRTMSDISDRYKRQRHAMCTDSSAVCSHNEQQEGQQDDTSLV